MNFGHNGAGRVLIADDDPVAAGSLSALLRGEGYQTATVADGDAALAMLGSPTAADSGGSSGGRELPFQVLLADAYTPRAGGVELVRQLRKRHPALMIVLLAGYGTIECAVEAIRHGAFDYLLKPVDPERLKHSVARALRQQSLLASDSRLHGSAGEELPDSIQSESHEDWPKFVPPGRGSSGLLQAWAPQPLRQALREPEKQILLAALRHRGWNRQMTAADLGIDRTTLYKKIKEYGLEALGD